MAKIAPEDKFSFLLISNSNLFSFHKHLSIDSYDANEPNIEIIRQRASEIEEAAFRIKRHL